MSQEINWHASAATVRWNIQPYINGHYLRSTATDCFDNVNPADESVLCRVPVGSAADVDAAVRIARERFEQGGWSELPPVKRADTLMKLADLLVQHRAALALTDTLEMGKPIQAALYDAEHLCPLLLRSWAGFADKLVGSSAPLSGGTLALNIFEPCGVVGAITPWNFPLANAVYKVGPALAAGNSVVLKPSEVSPSSALKLAELALEAGVPEGVLNVVPGLGSTVGVALASHRDVDLLSFTGSTSTGRKIMELAGRSNGKRLLLECGGKSPQVAFAEALDLDAVADAVVQSVLWNQGQVCSAHTRLIVHEHIKDALLEKILERARRFQPGDPLDAGTTFGPLASPAQRDRVKDYVEQGRSAGAMAVLEGLIQERGGCNVSPTVFDHVESEMSIAQEEIFGPVLCVQKFRTEEEAISLANCTDYGLVATAWTRDLGRGKRLAHAIKAGHVVIRTSGQESPGSGCVLSHEPRKASGFGAELGLRGLESYSSLKAIHFVGA